MWDSGAPWQIAGEGRAGLSLKPGQSPKRKQSLLFVVKMSVEPLTDLVPRHTDVAKQVIVKLQQVLQSRGLLRLVDAAQKPTMQPVKKSAAGDRCRVCRHDLCLHVNVCLETSRSLDVNMDLRLSSIKRKKLIPSFIFSESKTMTIQAPVRVPFLDLDLLQTLVAISETGSFSAAAKAVNRTPSAISMQVKKLEEIVDRPLFVRDSRSVTLTPDGGFLLEHARRMLALNREAVARFVAPDMSGLVRLGAPDDIGARHLPEMLGRFGETHPGVAVNVVIEGSDQMIEMTADGRLDLALVTCEGTEAPGEVVYREDLVWGMCAHGVAIERDPLPLSVWDEGCSWRRAAVGALDGMGRSWRLAFQSAHITGQRAAILADMAIAPIPRSSVDGAIVEVPRHYGLPPLPQTALSLVITPKPNPPVLAAADHLRAAFADVDVW